jgi:hypothetical protein
MVREHEPVTIAGVTYPSHYKAAVVLSLQTGIPEGTIRLRIRRGYADKWILHPGHLSNRACTDHTGREFPTVKEMCKAWGIAYGTVAKRLERGVGLKTALTAQPMWTRRHEGRPVTDHTGREFRSVTAMCQAWRIDRRTWLGRINAGWSLERSLTEPPPPIRMPRQDHTGRSFPTAEAMCLAWGQTSRRVRARLVMGWSLERALTTPGRRWSRGGRGI